MNYIDAVISWVDGNDPLYQKKLQDFCLNEGINKQTAIEPTRINQSNEIYYCLNSIKRFAPWIRTIYIITNQQTPLAIKNLQDQNFVKKIKIIDQNDLLKKCKITSQVFNSLSIEWLITQIDNLSENFLYLNDDFFIIRDVKPEDFFQNEQTLLRGEWKTKSDKKVSFKIKNIFSKILRLETPKPKTNPHRSWQEVSATLAGFNKKFYLLPHAPFPLLKSTFTHFIKNNPGFLEKNASYPFRHPNQISAIPLMAHLDLKQKRAKHINNHCQTIMVNGATHSLKKIIARLNKAHADKKITFVCMQSIDEAPTHIKTYLINWLKNKVD